VYDRAGGAAGFPAVFFVAVFFAAPVVFRAEAVFFFGPPVCFFGMIHPPRFDPGAQSLRLDVSFGHADHRHSRKSPACKKNLDEFPALPPHAGMEPTPISLQPDALWTVLARDEGHWRMGVYRPDAAAPEDIDTLERHTCPELFIAVGGRVGLLLADETRERVIALHAGEALLVEDFHNGFRIDECAYFVVIERTSFTTHYRDRATGAITRTVQV